MSNQPLQVGITGGIGSGKSVVCKIFNTLGVNSYDADSQAKWLMANDGVLKAQLTEFFGAEVYQNGKLNREFLAAVVFEDKDKLTKLNSLVHPRVAEDYRSWVQDNKEQPYLLKEAALLFESGSYKQLDKIIVVTAPEEIRIERVLARDTHRTKENVENIIKNQLPETEKAARADFVIKNDETRLLIEQVLEIHQCLL